VHDLLTFDPSHHQTVAVYDGVDAVRASSSASDAAAPGVASPGALPWAAVDGNPYTAWRSVSFDGPVGQWWEVRFAQPRDVTGLKVRFVSSDLVGPAVTQVEVRTDRGLVVQPATDAALSTPTGTTRTLRLTVKAVRGNVRTGNVGVSDVTVPGLAPARALQIPDDITATVSPTVVLGLDPAPVPTCVTAGDTTSCRGAALGLEGDPDGLTRVVRLNQGRVFAVSGTVLPTQSQDVLALLNPISPTVTVTASSTLGNSPAVRPAAAIDGDPRTSWVASPFDAAPVLHVRWPSARQLTSIRVTTGDSSGVAVPLRVHLTTPHGTRDLLLGPDGTAQFPVLGTDRVDVSFPELARSLAVDPTAPPAANIPVAVSELSFPSAHDRPYLPTAAQPTGAPCGFGPQIRVDDTVIETKVSGTVQDLLRSRPLRMEACGTASKGLTLTTGSHRIQVLQSARFSGSSLVLRPVTTDVIGSGDRTLDVVTWTAAHRTVNVGAGGAALLVVPENANVGWSATVNGRQLVARTVDGWQQGWLLPAGAAGTVRLDFQPDSPYRAGLFLGGLGALLLLVLSAVAVLRPDVRVPRPQPPVRMPSSLRAVGAVGVAALLAGWWGVALVGLCGLLVMRARGREWLPAGGVLAATLVTAGKAAEVGQTVQLLALAAVLAVLVTFVAT
jgi:arabinofuranan 3-O-arabinosyltransferase